MRLPGRVVKAAFGDAAFGDRSPRRDLRRNGLPAKVAGIVVVTVLAGTAVVIAFVVKRRSRPATQDSN